MSRPLRYYTSQELVRRRFKDFHGGAASAAKGRSIATHVEQGLNFFDASTSVPISIRPLTQYYGVAALTRAVALFCSPTLTEGSLKQGHGLSVTNWSVISSASTRRGLSELNLRVTNGLLTDVLAATEGNAPFRANTGGASNWKTTLDSPPAGTEFTFNSLLSLIPDSWREYESWMQIAPHDRFTLSGVSGDDETQTMEWVLTSSAGADRAKVLFPGEPTEPSGDTGEIRVRTSTGPHFQPVQLHHGAFDIGDVLLVPPITTDYQFSSLATLYATSYVLSMLARYRLSDWLAVWRGEKGDSARPLFERIMSLIESDFPTVCADTMESPTE